SCARRVSSLNLGPSRYITIHRRLLTYMKIRKQYTCIPRRYTVDVFPKYSHIHQRASPSIIVLEQSFLDLIAAIERASELSGERRRHWVCSLQQIANWLDRPAA